ncbi:hypothetical protein [Hutsoniella sourekii]|uniref:hypothetical protein n=1 Tax=Hutsoniella sourekii TaxID=87650 RepID=UPI0004AF64C2|nr:hypothetical protein [Hutsoniella sourekii]
MATYSKRALLTGAGSIYLSFMTKEETPATAPTYDTGEKIYETPSLDQVNVELELAEKKVHLSNVLHSDLSAVQSATIQVDAGYLPKGFAEEAQGMVNLGGGWSMPTQPRKKPFRMAIPFTDENGDELIVNFPKCTLSPVNISGETKREDVNEQLRQYNITGQPLVYRVADGKNFVFHQVDMADEDNKAKYDRDKLLEQGWYDEDTLQACEKTASAGSLG